MAEEGDFQAPRILADVHAANKDFGNAIRVLENEISLPSFPPFFLEIVKGYRNQLLPDLCSYTTIDAILEDLNRETIIPEGADWKFFRGSSEPPKGWLEPDFDDSSWEEGPTRLGYGDTGNKTMLEKMRGQYTTVYIRHYFSVDDPASIRKLFLAVIVDDGFVAYLNGKEVGRVRAGKFGEIIPYDGIADVSVEDAERSDLEVDPKLIQEKNVLAIQGLNHTKGSSDFCLLPSLHGEYGDEQKKEQKLLNEFRPLAKGEDRKRLLTYLEGRILQRAGELDRAVVKFRELAIPEESEPHPFLRLSEALALSGAPRVDVEAAFLSAQGSAREHPVWLASALITIHRSPKEILEELPESTQEFMKDTRWILEQLAAGHAIHINCGGKEYKGKNGTVWIEDRFYLEGNNPGDETSDLDINNTVDDPLYRAQRWFPSSAIRPTYMIPLPAGNYQVTLHFAEIYFQEEGRREFSVLLENEKVLEKYQPKLAAAETHSFENIQVDDGKLDIDFVHGARDNPSIAAIEIELVK